MENILITIMQCSVTIISILGGFIVSKYITINNEKKSTKEQMKENLQKISFFQENLESANNYLLEEECLELFTSKTSEILKGMSFDQVSEGMESQFSKDNIKSKWDIALEVSHDLLSNLDNLNSNGVPINKVKEYNDFQKEICYIIHEKIKENAVKPTVKIGYGIDMSNPSFFARIPYIRTTPYLEIRDYKIKLGQANDNLKTLIFENEILSKRLKGLDNPIDINKCLITLIWFLFSSVLYPLTTLMIFDYLNDCAKLILFWIGFAFFLSSIGLTAYFIINIIKEHKKL